jgi:hypothetical protein
VCGREVADSRQRVGEESGNATKQSHSPGDWDWEPYVLGPRGELSK